MSGYQLFDPLPPEAYEALKADIALRGVMVPVEYDEAGTVLDGHHRLRACRELELPDPPSIVRVGLSEEAKREHVLKSNLLRRHLGPVAWAEAFRKLAEVRGVRLEERARNDQAGETAATLAAELRVAPRTARYRLQGARALEQHPDLATRVDAGDQSMSTALNEARLRERRTSHAELAVPALPSGRYGLILADPPWRFEGSFIASRDVERFYPTLAADEIACYEDAEQRPVADLAADDAVLFLWTTSVHLPDALRVVEGWGFAYATNLVWVKDRIGMGWHTRNRHELLLLGKRGHVPAPLPEDRPDSVIEAPRGEHSAKPPIVYDLIERMYPTLGPRLELFARSGRAGWTSFGNDARLAEAAS